MQSLTTLSGRDIDLLNPKPEDFDFNDIAAGLAKESRFAGQVRKLYTVGQHTLLMCRMVPMYLRPAAALHDAPEFLLKDIPKPLKNVLGKAYTDIEHRFQVAIFQKYGVPLYHLELIKSYDKELYRLESDYWRTKRVANPTEWLNFCFRCGMSSHALTPEECESYLLDEFSHTFPKHAGEIIAYHKTQEAEL